MVVSSPQRPQQKPLLLRPADVAEELHCSYRTARQMIIDGELPSIPFGKRRRVPLAALEQWIMAQASRQQS